MNFLSFLLPELILFVGAISILLIDVFFAKKRQNFFLTSHFLALVISCIAAVAIVKIFPLAVQGEEFSFFHSSISFLMIKAAILVVLIFSILLSFKFVCDLEKFSSEYVGLMMIATCGGLVMISANNFLSFYLGLELQALSSYLLASFNTRSANSSESGMKYFILGSLASGLMLFGIGLIYGYSSSINFAAINSAFAKEAIDLPVGLIFGMVLVIVALLFKISAAPFHMWLPDIYQGAPTSTASFFATVGKMTGIFALINIIISIGQSKFPILGFSNLLVLIGLLSIITGSFAAIFQKNIKRLLAFSSISHIGFILIALSSLTQASLTSAIFYLLLYVVISLGSFAFLILIQSASGKSSDCEDDKIFAIESLSGLSKTNPIMAFAFSVLMFSSAGIPPLAGFFTKFFALSSAVGSGFIYYAIAAVIFSVISAFYYLRVIKIIYFDSPTNRIIILEDFGNAKFITMLAALINILAIFFVKDLMGAIENIIIS